ncbi:MAG: sulfatase [Candidatus Aminicenantes bacterium]|nr:sulfatase [Candidatus Aminicenantes bacterium]
MAVKKPTHLFGSSVSRREFLHKSLARGAAVALGGWACSGKKMPSSDAHPNLLVVVTDQMSGQVLGFSDRNLAFTPNLARFARQSVVFSQAVSNYPLCSPSRGMLMTGKYPHSHHVLNNCHSGSAKYGYELGISERCWSDVLKDNGYSLGYIGKWHLESPKKPYVDSPEKSGGLIWNEWCPPGRRHGFDFWYANNTSLHHLTPVYWATDTPRDKAFTIHEWGPIHEADLAVRYVHNEDGRFRDSKKPWALVVSMNPPHPPYGEVPQRYVEMYGDKDLEELCQRPNIPPADQKWGKFYRKHIKNYLAAISGVDEQFGRILEALRTAGTETETIVVFLSDHGNCLGIHNQGSKNNHYEEAMRIPLLIRWPDKISAGQDDSLISMPDICPSLLDLMGFKEDVPDEVEGASFAPLLRGGGYKRPTSQLYLRVPLGKPSWGRRGVRTHTHTLVISKMPDSPKATMLHDNVNDPYQLVNSAEAQPDLVRRLVEEELNPWLDKTGDPWLNNP